MTEKIDPEPERFEPLLTAIDSAEEVIVLTALAEGAGGVDFATSTSADLARHLLALARRPDFPLGTSTRDKYPELAVTLLEALSDAADPEQAARLLVSFFSRLATPSVYARAMDRAGNRSAYSSATSPPNE